MTMKFWMFVFVLFFGLFFTAPSVSDAGCCGSRRGCEVRQNRCCRQPVRKVLKAVARPFHRCCR